MLIDTLHPILGALLYEQVTVSDEDADRYIDRCWRVLFARQFERRGCRPWSLRESLVYGPRYAWRGCDGSTGGDVFGL